MKTREAQIEAVKKLLGMGYLPEDAGVESQKRRATGDISGSVAALGVASDMRSITRQRIISECTPRLMTKTKTLIVVLAAFLAGLGLESYIKDARVAKYEAFVKEDKQLIKEWDVIWEKDRDVCDRIERLSGQPPGYQYDDSDTRSYCGAIYLEHQGMAGDD